ncbi:DNA-binding transcriptional regulator YhcF, GntR family [Amphibacillus marinus]|uniref:DNA-binding transcriptional regulator YhcF, GntR family n=1 Tax=Amphibacillus marinus TaxID=872970 RepID=A0A1H8PIN6_9BACI|nr:GntR family transcriptional regulator [Amphibacillus marinus]SEO41832.1 DNA-binding transcriptional regulator YhcF, GntR family [Amphibacillus marinus]
MNTTFSDDKPLFLQIKQRIEDQIVNGQLTAHDQIPSTTKMVQFYTINHITISKGVNLLVDEGILYKKRGVGMFVAEGAKQQLLKVRQDSFAANYLLPMLKEAKKLGLSDEELTKMFIKIREGYRDEL